MILNFYVLLVNSQHLEMVLLKFCAQIYLLLSGERSFQRYSLPHSGSPASLIVFT